MPIGLNLTLLIGENTPSPLPRKLMEVLKSVEITHSDEGRSGFQIVFKVGRSGRSDLEGYQLVKDPLFKVFNRVVVTVTLGATAQVLMDGVITNHQLSPSTQPGQSTFAITGEDISLMMDLEEKSAEHTAQDEATIARSILKDYAKFGVIAKVVDPPVRDQPTENERIPSQQGTDLEYLKTIAQRYAYVFYTTPGPTSGRSTAYWGPPQRETEPQKALTVNMGSFTNVDSINFQNNALAATVLKGQVQDRTTNEIQAVDVTRSNSPVLAKSVALNSQAYRRTRQFRQTGRDTTQANARAQAMVNLASDSTFNVSGRCQTILYGHILQLRGLVELRGVGYTYDGRYYIKRVTHNISRGEYTQAFTLTREGTGTTIQQVAG
jgi:hypothetical protein